MADFQTSVNMYPAVGVEGAFASINPVVSTPLGKIAGTELTIGGFCWADTENENQVKNSGTGKPLGFVARNIIYPINNLTPFPDDETDSTGNIIPIGCNVNVMVAGDFYVTVSEAVTVGKKVFADTTNGSIKVGDAGGTVLNAVETDWAFVSSGSEGDTVIISNYGSTPVASGE